MHRITKRFLGIQTMMMLGLSLILGLFFGKSVFYAALWGGVCSLIPTGISMLVMFKNRGARQARRIVGDFYKGEALKLLVTLLLTTVAIKVAHVQMLPFLLTYIGTMSTIWLSPMIFKGQMQHA